MVVVPVVLPPLESAVFELVLLPEFLLLLLFLGVSAKEANANGAIRISATSFFVKARFDDL